MIGRPYGVHWWWVPIIGPLIGGPLGASIYYWLIEFQHPPMEASTEIASASSTVVAKNGLDDFAADRKGLENSGMSMEPV